MPQLDKFIFLSQYLWLCLLLAGGYYLLVAAVLPPLLAALKLRRLRLGRLRRSAAAAEDRLRSATAALALRRGRLATWAAALAGRSAGVGGRARTALALATALGRGRTAVRPRPGRSAPAARPAARPAPGPRPPVSGRRIEGRPLAAAPALLLGRLRTAATLAELTASLDPFGRR